MKRFFVEISYDGTNYHGWQKQLNAHTVQEEIEARLEQLFSMQKHEIIGCGRTDTGVHATQYFFHFDAEDKQFDKETLMRKLNKILPPDIAVHGIFEVHQDAHARFDAISRTYVYRIHQKKNPFKAINSWYNEIFLNVENMNEACACLFEHQDFTSFSKTNSGSKTNTCEIKFARWQKEGDDLIFTITANRFLRNMVRAIVGTLLQVGQGKITPREMDEIIRVKNRSDAGESVPAQGLTLCAVEYPFIRVSNK